MATLGTPKDPTSLTALALDGSSSPLNALSELYILQDAAGRWASDSGIDLRGEDVCPSDMFDIIGGTGIGGFYAILFARLELTVDQAIQAHRILEERLFRSEIWFQKQQNDCLDTLNVILDEDLKTRTGCFKAPCHFILREVEGGIPFERIVLEGFSQSAVMSLLSGLTGERKLAGIVALSGCIPLSHQFAAMASTHAKRMRVFSGQGDPLIQREVSTSSIEILTSQSGVQRATEDSVVGLTYRAYRGLPHVLDGSNGLPDLIA
ncbi:hypothetical protein DL96DRAFT_1661155 [Flagelloscypha sp. PMI_526]|nr:hypothetical protein DL96DRAFT_1661155 [Flagelloscypha sp. PMI_526]